MPVPTIGNISLAAMKNREHTRRLQPETQLKGGIEASATRFELPSAPDDIEDSPGSDPQGNARVVDAFPLGTVAVAMVIGCLMALLLRRR